MPAEIFVDFMPPEKKDVVVAKIVLASVPCKITQCYSFDMIFHDSRRVNVLGRGDEALTCTGIELRCTMLPGLRAGAEKTTRKARIEFDCESSDEEDDVGPAGPVVADNAAVPITSMMCNGWRVSYRTRQPDVPGWQNFRPALRRRFRAMAGIASQFPRSKRKASIAELVEQIYFNTLPISKVFFQKKQIYL